MSSNILILIVIGISSILFPMIFNDYVLNDKLNNFEFNNSKNHNIILWFEMFCEEFDQSYQKGEKWFNNIIELLENNQFNNKLKKYVIFQYIHCDSYNDNNDNDNNISKGLETVSLLCDGIYGFDLDDLDNFIIENNMECKINNKLVKDGLLKIRRLNRPIDKLPSLSMEFNIFS